MGPRLSLRLKLILAFLVLVAVLFFGRSVWLTAIGSVLVYDEGAAKADVAVVLAGDYSGNRLIRAIQLVQQGYVPRILVSGPPGYYGVNESEAAIRYAVQRGYPAEWFVAVPHHALSTRTEAVVMLNELRQLHVHNFLLVTSNYHTARSRRIYRNTERAMGGGPEFRMVAAADPYYAPDNWWHSREGWKTAFMEWTKTVTGALGI